MFEEIFNEGKILKIIRFFDNEIIKVFRWREGLVIVLFLEGFVNSVFVC